MSVQSRAANEWNLGRAKRIPAQNSSANMMHHLKGLRSLGTWEVLRNRNTCTKTTSYKRRVREWALCHTFAASFYSKRGRRYLKWGRSEQKNHVFACVIPEKQLLNDILKWHLSVSGQSKNIFQTFASVSNMSATYSKDFYTLKNKWNVCEQCEMCFSVMLEPLVFTFGSAS